jgi:hypothetical protein
MMCQKKILTTNKAVPLLYVVSQQHITTKIAVTLHYVVSKQYFTNKNLYVYIIMCQNNILTKKCCTVILYWVTTIY